MTVKPMLQTLALSCCSILQGTFQRRLAAPVISDMSSTFDRQWSASSSAESKQAVAGQVSSYVGFWLRMPLDSEGKLAISLWDIASFDGKRHAFATILDEHGVQANYVADVTYDEIWKSARTGNSYPRRSGSSFRPRISIFSSWLLSTGRTSIAAVAKIAHQRPVTLCCPGRYGAREISKTVIVAMIGDMCGQFRV